MFSCVQLHFKKCFRKYFLMFGCVLENTIENTFSTCCSHFLTFSRLPNEYIISFIPQNTIKIQKKIIKSRQTKARSQSARSQSARSRSREASIAIGEIAINAFMFIFPLTSELLFMFIFPFLYYRLQSSFYTTFWGIFFVLNNSFFRTILLKRIFLKVIQLNSFICNLIL